MNTLPVSCTVHQNVEFFIFVSQFDKSIEKPSSTLRHFLELIEVCYPLWTPGMLASEAHSCRRWYARATNWSFTSCNLLGFLTSNFPLSPVGSSGPRCHWFSSKSSGYPGGCLGLLHPDLCLKPLPYVFRLIELKGIPVILFASDWPKWMCILSW